MLDKCSQVTFVKEEIIEELGITGADTTVILKTLKGEISQTTAIVENLSVAGFIDYRKPNSIKLLK